MFRTVIPEEQIIPPISSEAMPRSDSIDAKNPISPRNQEISNRNNNRPDIAYTELNGQNKSNLGVTDNRTISNSDYNNNPGFSPIRIGSQWSSVSNFWNRFSGESSRADLPNHNPATTAHAKSNCWHCIPQLFHPRWIAFRKKMFSHLNSVGPQLFLGILLMLSLFMAESWVAGNAEDSTNSALYATLLVVFGIFIVEMMALCILQPGYFMSFFFAMDLIGTLSILLDVGWITDKFIPSGVVVGQGSVLRATRAAKLGARYGRLMRLLKLLRFLHSLPCFAAKEEAEPTMATIRRLSNELSNVLSVRVAFLVLLLVIVIPFLQYNTQDYSQNAWISVLKTLAKNESTDSWTLENAARKVHNFYQPKDFTLKYIHIDSPYASSVDLTYPSSRPVLRQSNIVSYTSQFFVSNASLAASADRGNKQAVKFLLPPSAAPQTLVTFQVRVDLDMTVENRDAALFGIAVLVLVILVLVGFTASFNGSVQWLVVKPMSKMLSTLRKSALVMLKSMKAYEKDMKKEEKKEKGGEGDGDGENEGDEEEDLEAEMLEKMIEKLARIVKHVLPGGQDLGLEGNVDSATANWLSQSYAGVSSSAASGGSSRPRQGSATAAGAGSQLDSVPEDGKEKDAAGEADLEIGLLDPAEAERLRLLQLDKAQKVVTREQLDSWELNVLDYSNEQLCEVSEYLFSVLNLLNEFQVPPLVFRAFLAEIASRYINSNTYHNFTHGVDVLHTVYRLLTVTQLPLALSQLEVFSLLVGSLAHDVGHLGVNNVYMIKAKHELALLHNDKSPLENMHCAVLYEVLGRAGTNIFVGLSEGQWREARKIIIHCILGTDMTHHFDQIKSTQLFMEVNNEDTRAFCAGQKDEIDCFKEEKNRLFIMELVLHCSDISNPYKPFEICAKWADLVVEEFCRQGDREKAEGLEVSPMCDRASVTLCNMQLGFIEFVVAPLIIAFVNIFPPLTEISEQMLVNYQSWAERRKGELGLLALPSSSSSSSSAPAPSPPTAAAEEEGRKLDERVGKFRDKMGFQRTLKELPRRKRHSSSASSTTHGKGGGS